MMYASLAELKAGQPVFSGTSYSDKTCIDKLRAMSLILNNKLAKFYTLPVSVAASGTLTFTGNVSEDDTVTAGVKTYTFKATPASENDVDIGADVTGSAINLLRAIKQGNGSGSSYQEDTTINVDCGASRSGLVLTITALKCGPSGNDIALSTTASNITASAAYLSGGLREFEILGELNQWMTTTVLLHGQANSNISGAGNRSLIDDIKDSVEDALADIAQNGGLTDTTGTILDPISGAMLTDCESSYSWAGTDDPVYWKNDPDRLIDRE
jgi:hypothetical protein